MRTTIRPWQSKKWVGISDDSKVLSGCVYPTRSQKDMVPLVLACNEEGEIIKWVTEIYLGKMVK
jgi:phage protein U